MKVRYWNPFPSCCSIALCIYRVSSDPCKFGGNSLPHQQWNTSVKTCVNLYTKLKGIEKGKGSRIAHCPAHPDEGGTVWYLPSPRYPAPACCTGWRALLRLHVPGRLLSWKPWQHKYSSLAASAKTSRLPLSEQFRHKTPNFPTKSKLRSSQALD